MENPSSRMPGQETKIVSYILICRQEWRSAVAKLKAASLFFLMAILGNKVEPAIIVS
jgi:hypothetical protein